MIINSGFRLETSDGAAVSGTCLLPLHSTSVHCSSGFSFLKLKPHVVCLDPVSFLRALLHVLQFFSFLTSQKSTFLNFNKNLIRKPRMTGLLVVGILNYMYLQVTLQQSQFIIFNEN